MEMLCYCLPYKPTSSTNMLFIKARNRGPFKSHTSGTICAALKDPGNLAVGTDLLADWSNTDPYPILLNWKHDSAPPLRHQLRVQDRAILIGPVSSMWTYLESYASLYEKWDHKSQQN